MTIWQHLKMDVKQSMANHFAFLDWQAKSLDRDFVSIMIRAGKNWAAPWVKFTSDPAN